MTEIAELERRITAAMDRIQRGVARVAAAPALSGGPSAAPADQARIAELEAQLKDERTVTAQLEERVRALKERSDGQTSATEMSAALTQAATKAREEAEAAANTSLTRMRNHLGDAETEIENLRRSNADLRDLLARLRSAMEEGLPSVELVNRAMKAELDALRATRAADRAELDAVIDELRPLIEEVR